MISRISSRFRGSDLDTLCCPGSDVGLEVDLGGPDQVRPLGLAPPSSASQPNSEPEKRSLVQITGDFPRRLAMARKPMAATAVTMVFGPRRIWRRRGTDGAAAREVYQTAPRRQQSHGLRRPFIPRRPHWPMVCGDLVGLSIGLRRCCQLGAMCRRCAWRGVGARAERGRSCDHRRIRLSPERYRLCDWQVLAADPKWLSSVGAVYMASIFVASSSNSLHRAAGAD